MAVKTQPKFSATEAQALFDKAHQAGMAALDATTPAPMVVGSPTTPLGSDIDPAKKVYYVPSGVCGFAWVSVRPRTSSLAKWLVASGKGRSSDYEKAVLIWVREGGQSLEKKEAYAHAFAEVLRESGVSAFAGSRMD